MSWIDPVAQGMIFVLGVAAIVLVARKNKWGFVCGLLSQPFWFITTFTHRQWGLVAMSVVYAATWAYGTWQWFRPQSPVSPDR